MLLLRCMKVSNRFHCVRFEFFTAVTTKKGFSGMLCHVALVRTDVLEEHIAPIITVPRTGDLGTLAVTSNCVRREALVWDTRGKMEGGQGQQVVVWVC
jgi:hypothetical protein